MYTDLHQTKIVQTAAAASPHQHQSLRFWIPTSDKIGKLIELAKDKRKKAIDFFSLHFQ